MWCPIADTATFRPNLPVPVDQPARLRQLTDAYGLTDRSGLVDAMFARVVTSFEWIEAGAAEGDPARTKMLAEGHADHYRRLVRYMESVRPTLDAAMA